MGAFQYQALQKTGNINKGVIEADSLRHARQLLRERGMMPTNVKQVASQTYALNKNKLTSQDLTLLTRQLATLIAAGIPVAEALHSVSEQTAKGKVRAIIMGVRSKVLEGYALAQSLGEFPYVFPELYRATIAAGEQTGKLDLVLEKLADYTERQQAIKQKISQALVYPSLMIIVSTTIICFLLSFVVPKIIAVFANNNQALPPMTIALIWLSNFCKSYGLFVIVLLIGLFFSLRQSLANKKLRSIWHNFLLQLIVLSYVIKSINVARYIHTFSILFAAGVSVLDSMKVSAKLINNLIIREAFDNATQRVKEGASISQALKEANFLSPMALHLIASGEKSGQIANMMERAALHLDQEVKRLIDTALTLLEPLVILGMGAMVLFIVLATLLPIFSMEQLV